MGNFSFFPLRLAEPHVVALCPALNSDLSGDMAPAPMRLSGLQKEVLSLYRRCLRESRLKPTEARSHFEAFARTEFKKHRDVEKRDFAAIEFLLRKGRRQLEVMASPGIKDVR
ncbi:heat repeat protein [Grosmannia clavigera kw1407]|uniref:Heat repeat protein n=1 Tax=Grosmannia clavigera (strain kw1407 / UAMH 11150) TaxID=655863 RepID=F0XRH5_GROCL|nr:heat repeat protein [Grosmannia clavigera kw1407]EFW99774.1 heat repeat protein [Grosmannia clavigera kw1407]